MLIVDDRSLQPDGRDSKYFFYSAFGEQQSSSKVRTTAQTAALGYRSRPARPRSQDGLTASNARLPPQGRSRQQRGCWREASAQRYFVDDKVHGSSKASVCTRLLSIVFLDDDVDVCDVGLPGRWRSLHSERRGRCVVRTSPDGVSY